METKKMKRLAEFGQSLWLDYIDRPLLETGKLNRLIEDGLRGMTSNPSIFNNAIGKTNDYDAQIQKLTAQGKSTFEIYDELTTRDIQDACDAFAGVYQNTNRMDGYVSLEINPKIAHKIDEQIKEGKRLFAKVNRPNVMIKVPSTEEGFPVIEELIASGINVNATLIFSVEQYQKTAQAYLKGLKRLAKNGGNLTKAHSVASIFVSRVDTAVDKILNEGCAKDREFKICYERFKGRAAVANCRLAYAEFERIFGGAEFKELKSKDACIQRLLWASTGTKNPDYSEIKYVMELITSDTVNTLPEATLQAYIEGGQVIDEFLGKLPHSQDALNRLAEAGIDMKNVCAELLHQGVKAFEDAFETLSKSIEHKSRVLSQR